MTTTYFEQASGAAAGSPRRGVALFALVCGAAACAAAAVWHFADPASAFAHDPELALLLRGMAAIKTLVVAVAIGAVAWRLRQPIGGPEAFGYAASTMAMSAATAAIWQLAWLVPAALAFHVGLVGFLLVAWRDDRVHLPLGRRA